MPDQWHETARRLDVYREVRARSTAGQPGIDVMPLKPARHQPPGTLPRIEFTQAEGARREATTISSAMRLHPGMGPKAEAFLALPEIGCALAAAPGSLRSSTTALRTRATPAVLGPVELAADVLALQLGEGSPRGWRSQQRRAGGIQRMLIGGAITARGSSEIRRWVLSERPVRG